MTGNNNNRAERAAPGPAGTDPVQPGRRPGPLRPAPPPNDVNSRAGLRRRLEQVVDQVSQWPDPTISLDDLRRRVERMEDLCSRMDREIDRLNAWRTDQDSANAIVFRELTSINQKVEGIQVTLDAFWKRLQDAEKGNGV